MLENGFGLERWAQRFYATLPDVPHVTLTEGITPLPIASDAYEGKPNPHAWMSPRLAKIYVENIRRALTKLDPAGADTFRRNAQRYDAQLDELHLDLQASLAMIPPRQRVLATCEGAFSYLAKDYGLDRGLPLASERRVPGHPPADVQLIALVRTARCRRCSVRAPSATSPRCRWRRKTGARFGGVFYVDSLSPAGRSCPQLCLSCSGLT